MELHPLTDESHRVEALIVNWNSGSDLERVVGELLDQNCAPPLRVLVVDNDSRDGSLARACRVFPDLEVVQAGSNLGYTGGNNLGFSHLTMLGFVLVVNPDVRLPGTHEVGALAAALLDDPSLALVAPIIVDDAGKPEYSRAVLNLRSAHVGKKTCEGYAMDGAIPQPWLDGAIFLARGPVLKKIGGFDDRFFLFSDEVDLAIRLRNDGWRLALAPAVRVHHARGSSFGTSRKGSYYFWRNLYLLCHIHAPGRTVWRAAWAARFLKNLATPSRMRANWVGPMLMGASDALRGRFGPGPEDR